MATATLQKKYQLWVQKSDDYNFYFIYGQYETQDKAEAAYCQNFEIIGKDMFITKKPPLTQEQLNDWDKTYFKSHTKNQ